MKVQEMDRWARHCNHRFGENCIVLHPKNSREPHIDMLLYPADEEYPFWKLITMGASDYKLPMTLCARNEFMMFIDKNVDLHDRETLTWYCDVLLSVALYPVENRMAVTFGHSIVWGKKEGTDMVCAYLELPYPVEDVNFLKCRLGPIKEAMALQVILLTEAEMQQLLRMGPEGFYDFLYPEGADGHFLCERYRSECF